MTYDKIIAKKGVEVYPVTLGKLVMMNFNPQHDEIMSEISVNNKACKYCKKDGKLCRKHSSLTRVIASKITPERVLWLQDTKYYIILNEIFSYSKKDQYLRITYCPHTKLIKGDLTKTKVKKIIKFKSIVPNFEIDISKVKKITKFELAKQFKFWFNRDWSCNVSPGSIFFTLNR